MIHFSVKHHFNQAYQWLSRNASGQCSILVDLPFGTAVYVWTPWINPLWNRLYGPVKKGPQ